MHHWAIVTPNPTQFTKTNFVKICNRVFAWYIYTLTFIREIVEGLWLRMEFWSESFLLVQSVMQMWEFIFTCNFSFCRNETLNLSLRFGDSMTYLCQQCHHLVIYISIYRQKDTMCTQGSPCLLSGLKRRSLKVEEWTPADTFLKTASLTKMTLDSKMVSALHPNL